MLGLPSAHADDYDDLQSAISGEDAASAAASDAQDGPPPPKRLGMFVSEAMQMRYPGVDRVPNSFSNVAGGGLVLRLRWIAISPQAHVIYSFTKAEVNDGLGPHSANASGLGWDAGMSIAIGAFEKAGNRVYAFAYPQFSSWHIEGRFDNGTTFDATLQEFATDFGAGITLPVTKGLSIDLFANVVHLGFRPQENQIVSVTSYPTFGANATWFVRKL